MTNRFVNKRDLEFQLFEVLDVEALTARPRFREHSRETFQAALDTAVAVAAAKFANHYRKADEEEPVLEGGRPRLVPEMKEGVAAFVEAGFLKASSDAEAGGMQLPSTLTRACHAVFEAANVAASSYLTLTVANAHLLEAHGSPEQQRRWVEPLLSGRFFGTMALTEPQAGSSLADVRTTATPRGDGTWLVSGTKTFISAGDHDLAENIVHLVLARIDGAPPGVKGISLFIVPKLRVNEDGSIGEPNDVALAGLFHKMGWRGTTSTQLAFGENGACVGELVGEPHRGLAYMFHMMNSARIGVGLAATMLGARSHLHAVDYAKERPQGRPLAAKDPLSPQIPIVEHADVRRMLLQSKAYTEGALGLCLQAARLLDEEEQGETPESRAEATALLDLLTPVVKAWPSQYAVEASSLAIQVLGGYGYTREYPVEQLYRDNRLNAIHEGTNGIQALDLLGRKAMARGGESLRLLGKRIARDAEEASAHERFREHAASLLEAWKRAGAAAMKVGAALPTDPERALANATPFLEGFGHVVVAWTWLRQAMAALRALPSARGPDVDFYEGKLAACRFFFRWELPKAHHSLSLVETLDPTCLEAKPSWL